MKPNQIRAAFFDHLIEEVGPALPSRKSMTSGVAWRSDLPGVYHHVLVLAYTGSFEHPKRHESPLPRIHLNHFSFSVSRAQRRRWFSSGVSPRGSWSPSSHRLELTVTLAELVDFAPWVGAWSRAVDAGDPSLLLALPHALEFARTPGQLLRTAYAWTARADGEYERRGEHRERG